MCNGGPAVRFDCDVDHARQACRRNSGSGVEVGCAVGAGLFEGRQHGRAAGAAQRLDEVISEAASDGVEKSTSKATSLMPACRAAAAVRRAGARPGPDADLFNRWRIDRDDDHVAGGARACQAKRKSVSTLRSPPCQPIRSTVASTVATRICGR